MKFAAVLIAATLAVVSAADCDSTALIGYVRGANGAKCTADTTYSPASLKTPEGDVLKKVCSNDACKGLLAEVTKLATPECTFAGLPVKATIIDPIVKACEALAASSGPAPTTAPGPGPAPTTKAPAPGPGPAVTPAPAC